MGAEILPIQLGLTAGNGLTLWAPRWREDGDEWEAFLGHGDDLYVFPTPAHLAAFIRTNDEHDLIDHPEWDAFSEAMTDELLPDDDHRFDIIGVPELVAETPDIRRAGVHRPAGREALERDRRRGRATMGRGRRGAGRFGGDARR